HGKRRIQRHAVRFEVHLCEKKLGGGFALLSSSLKEFDRPHAVTWHATAGIVHEPQSGLRPRISGSCERNPRLLGARVTPLVERREPIAESSIRDVGAGQRRQQERNDQNDKAPHLIEASRSGRLFESIQVWTKRLVARRNRRSMLS